MAQGVGEYCAEKLGRSVVFDSAGVGAWHEGERPDPRAAEAVARRGVDISDQRARAVEDADFDRFDHLIGLDHSHKRWLMQARDARRLSERPVSLLLDWSVGLAGQDVPDPYYEGQEAFERALDLIEKGVEGLVQRL